jgi:hypothetical protein
MERKIDHEIKKKKIPGLFRAFPISCLRGSRFFVLFLLTTPLACIREIVLCSVTNVET